MPQQFKGYYDKLGSFTCYISFSGQLYYWLLPSIVKLVFILTDVKKDCAYEDVDNEGYQ